tara:strand:+ start:346 stop:780 length:435 start_codon:yes stop_codon:yes gene_type:complete
MAGAKLRVSCVGDSITHGYGVDVPSRQGYPAILQGLLGDGYVVHVEGQSDVLQLRVEARERGVILRKQGKNLLPALRVEASLFELQKEIITVRALAALCNSFGQLRIHVHLDLAAPWAAPSTWQSKLAGTLSQRALRHGSLGVS